MKTKLKTFFETKWMHSLIMLLVVAVGLVFQFAKQSDQSLALGWWDTDWDYRIPITVDNTSNPSTLTDYQVYVEVDAAEVDFWTNAKADLGDIRFINPIDNSELDYFMQFVNTTDDVARFWVQIPSITASSSSSIHMYYGNAAVSTTSDEKDTFDYSSKQELFYVVNSDLAGATVTVVSLIDDNTVQLDAQTEVELDRQETTTFTVPTASSVLKVDGPVMAKVTAEDNGNGLVPISFAGTDFTVPSTRGSEDFYFYAPFADADVEIYDGTTLEAGPTTVSEDTALTIANSIGTVAIIESDEPVLMTSANDDDRDAIAGYPVTTRDLYGIRSNNNYIGISADSTDFDIACSNGSSTSESGHSDGTSYTNTTCASGGDGGGNAVRIHAITESLGSIQQADGDGAESTLFLPVKEMSAEYMVPTDTAYFAVACPPGQGSVSLSIFDETDAFVESSTCTPSGDDPGKDYFGVGDATTYLAGSRIVSTDSPPKVFYVYYEDTEAPGSAGGDENNLWGAVQARKQAKSNVGLTLNAQQDQTTAILSQEDFRWFYNTNNKTPSTAWSGKAQNVAIGSTDDPPGINDVLRLRMNLKTQNASLSSGSKAFKLQYGAGASCPAIGVWTDVDSIGGGGIWRGYNNPNAADGETIHTVLLSTSDIAESYEEQNSSVLNPRTIPTDDLGEWDWVIQNNGATANTSYCFRMVESDGTTLSGYTNYPQLTTNQKPASGTLQKPFNYAKVDTTKPFFEFNAVDSNNDSLIYEIQWDDDESFGSPITKSSGSDAGFKNRTIVTDSSPFNSGNKIRFTVQSGDELTDGTTYWWRVRAKDPGGSETFGDYSSKRSITVDTSITGPTWHQTTDEQLDDNTLGGVTISGSDSLITTNIVGEYGTVTLSGETPSTVTTANSYTSPIVVASPRYDSGPSRDVRISAKTATSFTIFVDDELDGLEATTTTVDWMVMEEGAHTLIDGGAGIKAIAGTKNVSGVGGDGTWPASETVTFTPAFSGAPAVFSTVTSNTDTSWITRHTDNGVSEATEPTSTTMGLLLNRSKVAPTTHGAEDIDYIAIDTGSGTNDGNDFTVIKSSDSIGGFTNSPPYLVSFGGVFSSVPEVAITGEMGADGADGGFPILYGAAPTMTDFPAAFDEAGDRSHTTEVISVVAFDSGGSGDLRATSATSTVTGTTVDIADLFGSSWDEASWDDDETSGSISYQLEYFDGGSFSLIPDIDLPGNSGGFGTSPIDISGLSTSTYDQIRFKATFAYSGGSPELFDWTISAKKAEADLEVTKESSAFDEITAGSDLNYDIKVKNNGPNAINSFLLIDVLPPGITTNDFVPSEGDYFPATGDWTGIDLQSGETITLTIESTVNAGFTGSLFNVTAASLPPEAKDTDLSNNQSSVGNTVVTLGQFLPGGGLGGIPVDFPICGNGVIEASEECDDLNAASGDGCDNYCQVEFEIEEPLRAAAPEELPACLAYDGSRGLNFSDAPKELYPSIDFLKNTRTTQNKQYVFSGQGNHSTNGSSDTWTFEPFENTTRLAVVKTALIANCIEIEENIPQTDLIFRDIAQNASPENELEFFTARLFYTAAKHGIIKGFHDRTARPYHPVTKLETLLILMRAGQVLPDGYELPISQVTDLPLQLGEKDRNTVEFALLNSIIDTPETTLFEPHRLINRLELSDLIVNIMRMNGDVRVRDYYESVKDRLTQ